MNAERFASTLRVLDAEIIRVQQELANLMRERAELRNGISPKNGAVSAKPATADVENLSIRAALRLALNDGGSYTVKELATRLGELKNISAKVDRNIIRGTLLRLADDEGWRKQGPRSNTRWSKAKTVQHNAPAPMGA